MDGYCECGEPGSLVLDPYALEVDDEEVPVVLCGDCLQSRCDNV